MAIEEKMTSSARYIVALEMATASPETTTARPEVAAARLTMACASSAPRACPLFALPFQIEQGVVDADRHADQQDDVDADAIVGDQV
nr:hypothetical protein [Nocardia terpenica]